MNKGKILTADPLKNLDEVQLVKAAINDDPRAFAIFSLGVNSAFRATDLLRLRKVDLKGNELFVREIKTGKLRRITLNAPTVAAIHRYWATRDDDYEWMFVGQRGKMTHGYLSKLIKDWCAAAGINGRRISTHTMRKSWVRVQHLEHKTPIGTLMTCLRHSTEAQTLQYAAINSEDVNEAYAKEI
jgi:integrase